MDKFKFILKGVLLWVTAFEITIFLLGVDSLYDNGYFLHALITVAVMVICCYKLISKKEFETLSLYRWFNNLIK